MSQYDRAVSSMAFENPWQHLFVADSFAKVHVVRRQEGTLVVESCLRLGALVGIGDSPQRAISMRHIWRFAQLGSGRGAVLCMCFDRKIRLLAVGTEDVPAVEDAHLELVMSVSL